MFLGATGICVLKPWALIVGSELAHMPLEMRTVFHMDSLPLLAGRTVHVSCGENSLDWSERLLQQMD